LARVPTNSGMLDDEFKSADHVFDPNDHRKFRDKNWLVYGIQKNNIIRPMAEELGLSLRAFALRWLASEPAMCAIEPNILSIEDVQEYAVGCTGEPLPADMRAQIEALYAADFHLGPGAHPCDIKSTCAPNGCERSQWVSLW
jgi:aryl-alcohol dehydrogenase-like predicted oxidoreductase